MDNVYLHCWGRAGWKLLKLLDRDSGASSVTVVVIYGVSGIGKTALASFICHSNSSLYFRYLEGYRFHEIYMDDDSDIQKEKANVELALRVSSNRPVFLFIDNARRQNLERLLSFQQILGLPQGSKILVTTKDLNETAIFNPPHGNDNEIKVYSHELHPLETMEAMYLLQYYSSTLYLGYNENFIGLVEICQGMPVFLKIAGLELRRRIIESSNGFPNIESSNDSSNGLLKEIEDRKKLVGGGDLVEHLVYTVLTALDPPSRKAFLFIAFFDRYANIFEISVESYNALKEAGLLIRSKEGKLKMHATVRKLCEEHRNPVREPLVDFRSIPELVDIAFFFNEWERSKVAAIVGEMELKCLEEAALVITSQEGKVMMNDTVEAIVRQLSECNRIIDRKSLSNLLTHKNRQKLKKIEGLWLRHEDYDRREPPKEEHLNLMSSYYLHLMSGSLRVLHLGGTRYKRCKRAFKHLRFLNISYEDMLSKRLKRLRKSKFLSFLVIRIEKKAQTEEKETSQAEFTINVPNPLQLQCLEVDASKLSETLTRIYLKVYSPNSCPLLYINGPLTSVTELQLSLEGFTSISGSFGNISVLKISSCSELSFGKLSSFPKLDMSDCSQLKSLHDSFGNLSSLEILRLSNCYKLEVLPASLGYLSSLRDLHMNHCSELKSLPDSFGYLSSLQNLDMSHCSELKTLPDSFCNLSSLEDLIMNHCSKLESLPDSFDSLSSLLRLNMSCCSELKTLPDSFCNLSSLKYLDMNHCSKLESLPDSFDSLSSLLRLNMSCCSELRSLSENFGNLRSIRHLNTSQCPKLIYPNSNSFENILSRRVLFTTDA